MKDPNEPPFDPGTQRYVSLETFRRNGRSVRTPVWLAGNGRTYYVFSAARAGKVKRIRADSHVRLAACDVRGRVKSDWVDADAHITKNTALINRAYIWLRRKYGWQMWITDFVSRIRGRYHNRAMIELVIRNANDDT